ncbi:Formamidopyrimidine-DNA glycosylase [Acorus gramineus]|uniref:Formamidopyrimidine-DNA glycosylase n=1 Tax=Acorus gramineus TaxID=55184 RepID=A0AAV9B542_ACOGR|nr:Formamidopyrimidine-DNA glycosylase [Acorus gramineus]
MPELPEVEAARRAIEDHCLGRVIKRCVVAEDPKVIDGFSPSEFESSLLGKTIVSARRKGKNLWLELDSPPFPSFQFGMAGAIYIKGVAVTQYRRSAVNSSDEWPSKYSKAFIELDDGTELSLTDKRRFAKVRLLNDPVSVPPVSELGPDALLEPMQLDEFVDSLSKKKIAIKSLLLDQSFLSGIGDWIADEVLYQSRIHPMQIASTMSKESCKCLHDCIKEVISKALDVGADISQFPENWIFHSREKKPGKAFVDGKKIEFITVGGRTPAYVPELQKLTGTQSGKAIRSGQKRKSDSKTDVKLEPGSDDEENAENTNSKGGQKGRRGTKQPATKRRIKDVEEADEDQPKKTVKATTSDTGNKKNDFMESESKDEQENEGEEYTGKGKLGKCGRGAKKPPAKKKMRDENDEASGGKRKKVGRGKSKK